MAKKTEKKPAAKKKTVSLVVSDPKKLKAGDIVHVDGSSSCLKVVWVTEKADGKITVQFDQKLTLEEAVAINNGETV